MNWPRLALAGVLALSLAACGRPQEGEGAEGETSESPAGQAAPETPTPAASTPAPAPATRPAAPAPRPAAVNEPWTPTDTGTVRPGMSRADVLAVWGKPAAERTADDRDYLYYRNGCEATCGTFDVVFLENGQVVDAIVRGRGHTYAGTSSSPPTAEGKPTLPGRSGS